MAPVEARISTGSSESLARARATYRAMSSGFRSAGLWRETAGMAGVPAFAWPLSQALAADAAMASLPAVGTSYLPALRRDLVALDRYWVGAPGLYGATRGLPASRASEFYDDNEWIAFDLLAGYRLLRDRALLARAGALFAAVVRGWDSTSTVCPGGIVWMRSPPNGERGAVTTANGALLAAELYRVTRRAAYLQWGVRMLDWVEACLLRPDGLIANDIGVDGLRHDRAWSYNQGAVIAAGVRLAQITGDRRYLRLAERTAAVALREYGTAFAGEPRIFVAIFFRDLALLDEIAPDRAYRWNLQAYADAQWIRRDLVTNLTADRGAPADLLDQAAMVQVYAQLAA